MVLAALKMVAGIVGRSGAMVADGIHSPVSYTHMTLPTNREVYISVLAGTIKYKR